VSVHAGSVKTSDCTIGNFFNSCEKTGSVLIQGVKENGKKTLHVKPANEVTDLHQQFHVLSKKIQISVQMTSCVLNFFKI
jgi:hypothetical protein